MFYFYSELSIAVVLDWHKDTVIGGHTQRESIIADFNAYIRSFHCMEATYSYAMKNQRKERNALGALSCVFMAQKLV